ncbi:MAG: uracil-DNA glycosylase family protein [Pseudomonadota bacterium]
MEIAREIKSCRLCAPRFAATATQHAPRPVTWFRPGARVLVAGQAPGLRVHRSGRPFTDPSGDRLRQWMGVGEDVFYDQSRIAIVPMAFCFPGYNAKGADLPPPKLCASTWREAVLEGLGDVQTLLLVGGAAQKWHLKAGNVTETVRDWRSHAPQVFPLPHPSWRNSHWIKKNPWFEAELLPALRTCLSEIL